MQRWAFGRDAVPGGGDGGDQSRGAQREELAGGQVGVAPHEPYRFVEVLAAGEVPPAQHEEFDEIGQVDGDLGVARREGVEQFALERYRPVECGTVLVESAV